MNTINATDGIRIIDSRSTASLLSKVLWITTAGFLFTALGAYIGPDFLGGIGYMALFIISMVMIFAIRAATRRSPALGLVMFYAFTVLMGIEVGPLIKMYLHAANGQAVVFDAAITTAVGMAVMAMVAQIARFDYRKLYAYAFAGLIGLVIIGVLSMFFHFMGPAAYSIYCWGGLAIFSVLLLVDFMRLRDTPASASPVMLALSIYLDALNIFIFLLQIFGNGSGSRSRR